MRRTPHRNAEIDRPASPRGPRRARQGWLGPGSLSNGDTGLNNGARSSVGVASLSGAAQVSEPASSGPDSAAVDGEETVSPTDGCVRVVSKLVHLSDEGVGRTDGQL